MPRKRFVSKWHTSRVVVGLMIGTMAVAPSATSAWPQRAAAETVVSPTLLTDAAGFDELASSADGLVVDWRTQIQARAEALLAKAPVAYKSTDLLEVAREAQRRMYDLGFMWNLSHDTRFAVRLLGELEAVAAFPSWNPKDDLSLGDMSHAVAIGIDWLGGYLVGAQRASLIAAVQQRAFAPVRTQYDNPSASEWAAGEGNWNVVINSGIGLAALAVRADIPTEANAILASTRISIQNGLRGYADDGSYFEGLTYWNYSTTNLVTFVAALRSSLSDDWGLIDSPSIQNTGTFPLTLLGPSARSFNYGDSWSTESFTEPVLGLAALTGDSSALNEAVVGYDRASADSATPRALVWYEATRGMTAVGLPLESSYPGAGVVTARSAWDNDDASFFALKASPAQANGHSDLDSGTFVYDALGVNWFSDLGADSYDLPGYFETLTGSRWNYYRKSPEGHNTLAFDNSPRDSARSTGSMAFTAVRPDVVAAVADLSSSAPDGVSWKRGIKLFDGRQQLLVQDEVQSTEPTSFWAFMHTRADIKLAADGRSAVLSMSGQQVLVRLLTPSNATLLASEASPLATSPQSLAQDGNDAFRKLGVHIEGMRASTVAVQISPVVPGQPQPPIAAVSSLSSWSSTKASAQLTGISVGGVPIKNFRSDTLRYDWGTAKLDTVKIVSARATAGSSVTISQAQELPGVARITVSKSGLQTQTYLVHFVRGKLSMASVSATSAADAGNLIDGDVYSRWTSTGFQRVSMDLGMLRRVNHVEINWGVGGSANLPYNVQTSVDGSTWQVVFAGVATSTRAFQWASFTTGAVNARYVRVSFNPDGQSRRTNVNEMRVFGDNAPYADASPITPKPSITTTGLGQIDVGQTARVESAIQGVASGGAQVTHTSSDPDIAQVDGDSVIGIAAGDAIVVSEASVAGWVIRSRAAVHVRDAGQVVLSPVADSHVQGGAVADTSYARSPEMYVRHVAAYPQFDRYAYMTFDLSGIVAGQIQSAVLSMTARVEDPNGHVETLSARSVSAAWTPATLTFNSKPAMGAAIGDVAISPVNARVEMDVSDYVRLRAGGATSLALTEDQPQNGVGQLSVIGSSRSSTPPTLIITLRQDGAAEVPQVSISSARSKSASADGYIRGTVAGTPHAEVVVEGYSLPRGSCLPVAAAASIVGSATVLLDGDGRADFDIIGNLQADTEVFARVSAGAEASYSTCTAVANAEVVLAPVADSHVQGGAVADTSYARSPEMYVRHAVAYPQYDRYAYMTFDLSGVAANQIESAVVAMTARVEDVNGRNETLNAHSVGTPWAPATLTFNTKPAMGETVGATTISPSAARVYMDVSDYVRLRAGASLSLALTQDQPMNGVGQLSIIGSSRSSTPPSLIITLKPAEG